MMILRLKGLAPAIVSKDCATPVSTSNTSFVSLKSIERALLPFRCYRSVSHSLRSLCLHSGGSCVLTGTCSIPSSFHSITLIHRPASLIVEGY